MPRAEELLGIMLDEVWSLNEAIDELERRREKLRDHILAECRHAGIDRWRHPGGTATVQRYKSYKVARPSALLPVLRTLRWEDRVLQVKGRQLHALAAAREDARAYFSNTCAEVDHEVLYLRPRRAR